MVLQNYCWFINSLFLILIMSDYFPQFCCNLHSYSCIWENCFPVSWAPLDFFPFKMLDSLIEKNGITCVFNLLFPWLLVRSNFLSYVHWPFIFLLSIASLFLFFLNWLVCLFSYWFFGRLCMLGINSCFVISATDNLPSPLFVFWLCDVLKHHFNFIKENIFFPSWSLNRWVFIISSPEYRII